MNYCEECGAKLQEGMKFCGNCGSPVPADEAAEPPEPEEVPVQEGAEKANQEPLPTVEPIAIRQKAGKMKKGILAAVIVIVILAVIAVVLWQTGVFSGKEKTADAKPVQIVDQENLHGTLDWKEDQDQEYVLKNALIEGNSDANVKEIFEESAYFTTKRYQYAVSGKDTYYQIVCQYEKEKKTIPYVLVFQVNEQEHLELSELYKKEKKIDKAKFDSFYKKLYKTKADVEAEKAETEAKAVNTLDVSKLDGLVFYNFNGRGQDTCVPEVIDSNTIQITFYAIRENSEDEEETYPVECTFYSDGNGIRLNSTMQTEAVLDEGVVFLTIRKSDGVNPGEFPYMLEIEDEVFDWPDSYVEGVFYAEKIDYSRIY